MTSLMLSRGVAFRTLPSAASKRTAQCKSTLQLQRNSSTLLLATTAAARVPIGSDRGSRRRSTASSPATATAPFAAHLPPPSPVARPPRHHPLPAPHNRVLDTNHQTARRSFWQEVVRERVDPDTGEVVWSEGARAAGARAERAEASERIDERHKRYLYHEKPTSKRRRMAEAVKYRAKKTKVMELVRYIKFTEQADEQGDQGQKGKRR